MKHRGWSYHLFIAVAILLAGLLLAACRETTTPTVGPAAAPAGSPAAAATKVVVVETPSHVRRELALVWAGPSGPAKVISIPKLDDGEWHELPAGGLVFTDDAGEGWVRITDCMLIYIFQHSQLVKAPCPKSDYIGGNVTCAMAGTSVYNNSCAAQMIIQTPGAELALEGTWLSVTYLPGAQVTLALVFEGRARARPVQDTDTYTRGEAVEVAGGYFWFTTPGATAGPIAGLTAREPHPFDQLLPLVEELDLWPWIGRITARADADRVPYPAIPPFVRVPTPTLTPQSTSVPPSPQPIVTPCGPPANWAVYVVQADDTLYSLATKTGTSVEQIKLANCLVGDTVFVGQRLYLPFVPTPTPSPTPCGPPADWVVYVVQAEDTLYSLATKTGTSVEQIKLANCLVGDTVFPGQRLYLPYLSLPDLAVSDLQTTSPAPAYRQEGITIPIRVVVKNQGDAAASTFVVCVAVPGQEDVCLPSTTEPLAAGSEAVLTGMLAFSSELQGQTVTLTAMADSCGGHESLPTYCRVKESHEDNNESAPLVVLLPAPSPQPDLAIYDFSGPKTAWPGQDISGQIRLIFTNQGNAEAGGFLIYIVISPDKIIDTSDVVIGGKDNMPAVAPGQLVMVNFDAVRIPEEWPLGASYIDVILDPANSQPESNEDNNTDYFPISVSSRPSLPAAPSNLNYDPVGCRAVYIVWQDNADNETGYYIYRNGSPIATLPANTRYFADRDVSPGEYTYGVAAFNANGGSTIITISVTVPECPSPK